MNVRLPETQRMLREAVLNFRCVELRECLQVINLPPRSMRKPQMLSKLLHYIDSSVSRDMPLFSNFVFQVFACEQRLVNKNDKRRKSRKKPDPASVSAVVLRKNKFFDTLRTIKSVTMVKGVHTGLEALIEFMIPFDFITVLKRKSHPHAKTTYEVQLLLEDKEKDEWEETAVEYNINSNFAEELQSSPPIIYLPKDHLTINGNVNKLLVKLKYVDPTRVFQITINIVRRYSPSVVMKIYPIPEVERTEELIKKYFEETGKRVYEISTICPFEKKLMQYPCRSNLCFHPDMFDLESFFNRVQYFLKWRCPICSKPITLESLEQETYFRKKDREGKIFFTFYKKAVTPPRNEEGSEVTYDHECITLD